MKEKEILNKPNSIDKALKGAKIRIHVAVQEEQLRNKLDKLF